MSTSTAEWYKTVVVRRSFGTVTWVRFPPLVKGLRSDTTSPFSTSILSIWNLNWIKEFITIITQSIIINVHNEKESHNYENWKDISVELLAQYSYKPKSVIYNIISRLQCRNTDKTVLKFHEDTFVRHEFCKTNLQINFTVEHENNTRRFTQIINPNSERQ